MATKCSSFPERLLTNRNNQYSEDVSPRECWAAVASLHMLHTCAEHVTNAAPSPSAQGTGAGLAKRGSITARKNMPLLS